MFQDFVLSTAHAQYCSHWRCFNKTITIDIFCVFELNSEYELGYCLIMCIASSLYTTQVILLYLFIINKVNFFIQAAYFFIKEDDII